MTYKYSNRYVLDGESFVIIGALGMIVVCFSSIIPLFMIPQLTTFYLDNPLRMALILLPISWISGLILSIKRKKSFHD